MNEVKKKENKTEVDVTYIKFPVWGKAEKPRFGLICRGLNCPGGDWLEEGLVPEVSIL